MPEAISGNDSSGLESHCSRASRADSMKPIDSSSGVVCALPTTKLPAPSTMNVSVIVPPASIASTRGSRSAIGHLGREPSAVRDADTVILTSRVSISRLPVCLMGDHSHKEEPMKYMLLIHQGDTPTPRDPDAWGRLSQDEQQAVYADYQAIN